MSKRSAARLPAVLGTLMAAGLTLTLAACGTSASSGSSSGGSSGANASSGSVSASYLASAKAAVTSLMQRPTSLTVPSLASKPPSGKTLDFMACGLPVCQSYISIVQQAAAAIGWTEQTIQIGLTPQTETNGYEQAVRNDPGGIIGSGGVAASVIATQLKALKAENVPVVLVDVASAGDATAAVLSTATQTLYGQEMAQWMLANAGGKDVHVAVVTTSATPVYAAAHTGIQQELAPCGSCSVVTDSFPITDIGSTLPTEVISFLRTHPTVNYLFFDFSNEVDGVPAALQSAGLASKVKITTTDTTATETGYLKNGEESATAGIPWPETLWNAFNIILRKEEGMSVTPALDIKMPRMIYTGSNVLASTTAAPPPLVASYQSLFKTAWHEG